MANTAENKGFIKGLVIFSGVAIVIAVIVFFWQYLTGGLKNPPQISPTQRKKENGSGDNTTPPQYSDTKTAPAPSPNTPDWAKDDGSDARSTNFATSQAKEIAEALKKAIKNGSSIFRPCGTTKDVVAELLKLEKLGNGLLMLVGREYEKVTVSTLSKDLTYYFFGGFKPCSNGDGFMVAQYGISLNRINSIIDTLKNYKL